MDGRKAKKAKKAEKAEKGDRGFAFFFTQKKWDVLFGELSNKTTFNRKNDEEISVTRKTKAENVLKADPPKV